MTTEADRINQALTDEARATLRTRIDLDAFLALSADERGNRWRQWDASTKADAVIQQLNRLSVEWDQATVERFVAQYDAKWEASDLALPSNTDVLAVVMDRREAAELHDDLAGVRLLDRVRANILNGARMSWHLGDLLIQSVNNPGQVYAVNRRGCTCPNGAAGKAQCWHVVLFDILLDMAEERAASADIAALSCDPPGEPSPLGDEPGDTPPADWRARDLGRRICEARSRLAA